MHVLHFPYLTCGWPALMGLCPFWQPGCSFPNKYCCCCTRTRRPASVLWPVICLTYGSVCPHIRHMTYDIAYDIVRHMTGQSAGDGPKYGSRTPSYLLLSSLPYSVFSKPTPNIGWDFLQKKLLLKHSVKSTV